jgi:hypothetical protein
VYCEPVSLQAAIKPKLAIARIYDALICDLSRFDVESGDNIHRPVTA